MYNKLGDFMNVGIICEYNPLHFGHLLHIKKIKEMYPNCNIILVISGWITQRGELSLIDKYKKCEIALNSGADLVIEIPFKFMQSADYFAKGAIGILNKLKVNTIVFGSESNNIDKLYSLARAQINNNLDIKKYLSKGDNYPTALARTLKEKTNIHVNTPNDLLGISYIKEILKNNYNIKINTIKRESNYNSKIIEGKITSSTSIREALKNNKDIKDYVPDYEYKYLKNCLFIDDYFNYLKYKIISSNDITIYQGVDKVLENRIRKQILKSNTLDELIQNIKSKNYTYNRIKRTLTFILLSITKKDCNNYDINYIKVLGFNNKGKKILNCIKKDIDIPIITKFNPKYESKSLEIVKILSLNDKIKDKDKFIQLEYKTNIIKK